MNKCKLSIVCTPTGRTETVKFNNIPTTANCQCCGISLTQGVEVQWMQDTAWLCEECATMAEVV